MFKLRRRNLFKNKKKSVQNFANAHCYMTACSNWREGLSFCQCYTNHAKSWIQLQGNNLHYRFCFYSRKSCFKFTVCICKLLESAPIRSSSWCFRCGHRKKKVFTPQKIEPQHIPWSSTWGCLNIDLYSLQVPKHLLFSRCYM